MCRRTEVEQSPSPGSGHCYGVSVISAPAAVLRTNLRRPMYDVADDVFVFLCFILHSCCINVSTVGWT